MRSDRWLILSVIGAWLACLASLTPFAALAIAAVELGAWAGYLDIVLLPVLAALVGLAIHRYRVACRRTP